MIDVICNLRINRQSHLLVIFFLFVLPTLFLVILLTLFSSFFAFTLYFSFFSFVVIIFCCNSLLTEIERHEGIVFLATNRPHDLDEAMHRRITAVLEYRYVTPQYSTGQHSTAVVLLTRLDCSWNSLCTRIAISLIFFVLTSSHYLILSYHT